MYYICIARSGLGILCLSVLQDHHADAALPGMEEAHLWDASGVDIEMGDETLLDALLRMSVDGNAPLSHRLKWQGETRLSG